MMRSVALLVTLCVLVSYTHAQVDDTLKQTLLDAHNYYRANPGASGSPNPATPLAPLVWDDSIAEAAQSWASECQLQNSQNNWETTYGEGLAYMNPPSYFNVDQIMSWWMAGGPYFDFDTASCNGNGGDCGVWLQVMSQSTTSMGCGVATCNFGQSSKWIVCDYAPFFQWRGVIPYQLATNSEPTDAPTPADPTDPPTPTDAPTAGPTSTTTTRAPATTTRAPTTTTRAPTTKAPTNPPASGYPTIDYRETNIVLPVQDQGQCGSCWAFSTAALVEGAIAKAYGSSQKVSEQNILDCTGSYSSCNGGCVTDALDAIVKKGGVDGKDSYPYNSQNPSQGSCQYTAANTVAKLSKRMYTGSNTNFAAVYNALKTYGPVGIALNANTDTWYYYESGVISYGSDDIDHAVTIVGYDADLNAWIIKNSWGTSWGMSGYVYVDARAATSCGIYKQGAWYGVA